MVTVKQDLTIAPTSVEREQPAFVFGPSFYLHRYTDEAEKAGTYVGLYEGASMSVRYPSVLDEEKVDKSFTRLFGDNVVVELANIGSVTLPEKDAVKAVRDANGGYTLLGLAGEKVAGQGRMDALKQDLKVGDTLIVSYQETGSGAPTTYLKTTVKGFRYYDSATDIDSSLSGGDSSTEIAVGTVITIGDAIPDTVNTSSVSVKLVEVRSGVEFTSKDFDRPGNYQWTQPDTKLTDSDGSFYGVQITTLKFKVTDYFEEPQYSGVLFADLYVQFRELDTSYADNIHSVTGDSQVEGLLGAVSPDNPLAEGVHMACLNAASGNEAPPVYFMAIPTNDSAGWDFVLNKASLTSRVYNLAPVTRDGAVIEKVMSHVASMSSETEKQWRVSYVSKDVPETVPVLDSSMDLNGNDYLAIPVSPTVGVAPDGTDYTMLRVTKSVSDTNGNTDIALRSANLKEGDIVLFRFGENAWGETEPDTYTVKRVVNNYTVEVYGKVDVSSLGKIGSTSYVPAKIEIYHRLSASESADEIASLSRHLSDRRTMNVFPPKFVSGGVEMTGEFAACAIAGLVSSLEPQQPFTNMTVRGIDSIPLTYSRYGRDDLNRIAAGGTLIIAQDLPDDVVYVRHQITTAYSDGNLNTGEISITKNVDSISYAFADTFRPYYGKYNIFPGLIAILNNLAVRLIDQFAGSSSVYGPQLIAEETEILYIRQNPLVKDHVDVAIRLSVPYPCNRIDIVLTV